MKTTHFETKLLPGPLLPFYRSGWFYCLFLLATGCVVISLQGGFDPVNRLNLSWLAKAKTTVTENSANETSRHNNKLTDRVATVVRVKFSHSQQDYDRLQQLMARYPKQPILVTGHLTQQQLDWLKVHSENRAINDKPIVVTENRSSNSPLVNLALSKDWQFNPLKHLIPWHWLITEPERIEWTLSPQAIMAPSLIRQADLDGPANLGATANLATRANLVWRDGGRIYLSAHGEMLRQLSANNRLRLVSRGFALAIRGGLQSGGLQSGGLQLVDQDAIWPLGFNGQLIAFGQPPKGQTLIEFWHDLIVGGDANSDSDSDSDSDGASAAETNGNHNHNNAEVTKVFVIEFEQSGDGASISQMAQSLLDGQYLYQSLLVNIISALLFLAIGWLLWATRNQSLLGRFCWLIIYLVSLALCQYLAFQMQQWIAIGGWMVFAIFAWLAMTGYAFETKRIAQLNERFNQLMVASVENYYQFQSPAVIEQLLNDTWPESKTLDKLGQIAYQAEASGNLEAMQTIQLWLEKHGHKAANKKQNANNAESKIAPSPDNQLQLPTESGSLQQDNFDQTMVIGASQNTSSFSTNPLLKVKNFGRYHVEGVLGKGAMGIVYQGVDPKINRHVAIKTLQLNPDHAASHFQSGEAFIEAKQRFFREAQTAGNLSHANIVTIYDVGDEGDLGYIAMDLLTGAPLSEFVKPETRLPIPLIFQLMVQITDALDYAHQQQVVHRDIKPANIIFDDDVQRVTLTDFGIAYVADNASNRSGTSTGTIVGSPYYMSPEQVCGQSVDGRSDIFSLGVTLYQLLTGYLPFAGDSIATVIHQITHTKQVSVSKWDPSLPASAVRITNKAMQKDKAKRYQTMQEFKLALINSLKRDFKKNPF